MSNQGNQSHFKEREAYWPFVREIHVNVGLPMIVNVGRNFPPKLKQPAWFLSLSIDPQLRPQSEIAGGYVQQGGFFLFSFETSQVQTGMAKSFLCSLEENLSPYSVSWSVHLSASSALPPWRFCKGVWWGKALTVPLETAKKRLDFPGSCKLDVLRDFDFAHIGFFNLSVISVDMKCKSYLFDLSFQ